MGDNAVRPTAAPRKTPPIKPEPAPKPKRRCFQYRGAYGSPRLIFMNRKFFGLALKFSAAMEYVTRWRLKHPRVFGIRGAFEVGLSGINLQGGKPKKYPISLLGIHGGIGIAYLVSDTTAANQYTFTEYTPRVGLDYHAVKLSTFSIMIKGGYIMSIMKSKNDNTVEKSHGWYASLGVEFTVPYLVKLFSPQITITYAGYMGRRHELVASAGLRY